MNIISGYMKSYITWKCACQWASPIPNPIIINYQYNNSYMSWIISMWIVLWSVCYHHSHLLHHGRFSPEIDDVGRLGVRTNQQRTSPEWSPREGSRGLELQLSGTWNMSDGPVAPWPCGHQRTIPQVLEKPKNHRWFLVTRNPGKYGWKRHGKLFFFFFFAHVDVERCLSYSLSYLFNQGRGWHLEVPHSNKHPNGGVAPQKNTSCYPILPRELGIEEKMITGMKLLSKPCLEWNQHGDLIYLRLWIVVSGRPSWHFWKLLWCSLIT